VPWSLVPVLNCGNQLKFIQTPTSSTIHYPLVNWIRFHFATPSRRSPTATGDLTRSQAHKLGRSCSRDTVRGAWAWHDGDSDARRPKSARSEGRDDAVCMTIRHHEEAWRSITSIIARQDPHRERSRWDHRRLGHRDCWNQVQYESHLGVRESIHVSWPALLPQFHCATCSRAEHHRPEIPLPSTTPAVPFRPPPYRAQPPFVSRSVHLIALDKLARPMSAGHDTSRGQGDAQ
jgi:hypothetical protein